GEPCSRCPCGLSLSLSVPQASIGRLRLVPSSRQQTRIRSSTSARHTRPGITNMPYERELQVALEAVGEAGRTLLQLYEAFAVIADAPADISTDADRQSQEIILGHLRRAFPHDALSAEEQTGSLAGAAHTGKRLWIVDPIDGTRGFARKNGEFSVMVGFVDDGRIGAGVVLEPTLGRLTYAVRGGGCWRRDGDQPAVLCRVSTTAELARATL